MSYLNFSKNALIATLLISSFQSALASSHQVTKATQATGHNIQGVYSDLLLGYGWTSANKSSVTVGEGEFSGNLDLGYQFNPNFALELGLGYTANLSAKFILPLNQCNDLFAKVGGGVAVIETRYPDNSDYNGKFAANLSVGATHWLTQNWGLTGQINYARIFADGNDTSYNAADLTVGVSYHF